MTNRQRQVLYWIARGKTSAEVGQILGLSYKTIDKYVLRICQIYDAPNRTCAVMRGLARGDISAQELMSEFA